MLMNILRNMMHVGSVANFAYAIRFQLMLEIPGEIGQNRGSFGGPWKFLTFWNLWIQCIFSAICLMDSIFSCSILRRIRDFYFSTLAFPIGMFVGIMFWALWFIDRELVMPSYFDEFIPVYVNHMLHTTCLIVVPLELLTERHAFLSKTAGFAVTTCFCMIYLGWTMYVAIVGKIWIYPIFQVLPPFQRYAYMLFCAGLGGFLFLCGDYIDSKIWKKGRKIQIKSKSSKKAR